MHGVNASLAASVESRLPIRVIRGYKLQSAYAPEAGYRYDGSYTFSITLEYSKNMEYCESGGDIIGLSECI